MSEEKLVSRYFIEDKISLFMEMSLRNSILLILPFSVSVTLLSIALQGFNDEEIVFYLSIFLMVFIIGLILIMLPISIYIWSTIKRRSYLNLNSGSIEIYMEGYMDEYVHNRIPLMNIKSISYIDKNRSKDLKKGSILFLLGIFPRPKRIPIGFYHALSKPDKLVVINLFHRVPIYTFHKHTHDFLNMWSRSDHGRLTDKDHNLVADTSGQRSFNTTSSSREFYQGPAIRRHITDEIYVKIENGDELISTVTELVKNNKVPSFDPTPFDRIRLEEEMKSLNYL